MSVHIPGEVIKQIFMKIEELQSLIRLQLVSKIWKNVIDEILLFKNWKNLCLKTMKEIPLSYIPVISPKLNITNHKNISDQNFWQKLFYHHQHWLHLKKKKSMSYLTRNQIPFKKDDYVTCCDVWSHWLACGTNRGNIYIFVDPNYQYTHSIIKHEKKAIKQVKFWYNGDDNLHLVSLTKSKKMDIWNMNNGEKCDIVPVYLVDRICIGTAYNFYAANNTRIIKYKLTNKNTVRQSIIKIMLLSQEEIIDAIESFEPMIKIVVRKMLTSRTYILVDESIESRDQDIIKYALLTKHPELPRKVTDVHAYTTLNKTLIYAQRKMINLLWMDSWIPYIVSNERKLYVNCLVYHGHYLIFGLTNGELRLQHIEDIFFLSDPSFLKKNPMQIVKISSKPIVDIKIVQDDKKVNIVVVSESEIVVLNI